MNRAVGRRAMFETDADVQRLLRRVAEASAEGWIEVHAWVVMQTHYHFLLRSLTGALSAAMHFIQAPYAQWFNRSRERDGPIHRGRFHARRIESEIYQRVVVSYIDQNPVVARMVQTPERYPHGSAYHFARMTSPKWHARWWVEEQVSARLGTSRYEARGYPLAFPSVAPQDCSRLAEETVGSGEHPPIDYLLTTTDAGRAGWLQRMAGQADGTRALRPVLGPAAILEVMAGSTLDGRGRQGQRSPHALATAWLLRVLCGSSFEEIGHTVQVPTSTAHRTCQKARRRVQSDEAFAHELATLTERALATAFAPWR